MNTVSTGTELNLIEAALPEFKNAAEVLRSNQERAAKAVAVGNKLLSELEEAGGEMTEELDTRMNNYLVNCAKASKEMNENRKAFTQTLTIIQRAFTSEEAKLDKENKETPAYKVQQVRNAFVLLLKRREEERKRKIEEQQKRTQELKRIENEVQLQVNKYLSATIENVKTKLNDTFNLLTLETIEEYSETLSKYNPIIKPELFEKWQISISSFIPASEYADLVADEKNKLYSECNTKYGIAIGEQRDYLIERIPSKNLELLRIKQFEEEQRKAAEEQERLEEQKKQADAAERERIEAHQRKLEEERRKAAEEQAEAERQKAEREAEETARIKAEEEQRKAAEEQKIQMNANIAEAVTLFETEKAISETIEATPEARAGYEIEIKGAAAYLAMFTQWFHLEGQTMTLAALEKKLGFVKTYCEKLAHKDETKKLSNPLLKYNEVYTAVNRKK